MHADILSSISTDEMSDTARVGLIGRKAVDSLRDYTDGNNIAELGDLTSYYALGRARDRMRKSETGRRILEEQPRVTSATVDIQKYLQPSKAGTLGQAYAFFMSEFGFKPEERPLVKHVPDYELAYVMQRYREVHDFIHPLIGCPSVTVLNELYVKWFEMIQLDLPSAALGSTFGSLLAKDRFLEYWWTVGRVTRIARQAEFILNIYFEEHLDDNFAAFRKKFGFKTVN